MTPAATRYDNGWSEWGLAQSVPRITVSMIGDGFFPGFSYRDGIPPAGMAWLY